MERITDFPFSVFKIQVLDANPPPATVARSLTFFKASFHGSCSAAEKPSQAVHSVSLSSSARRPVRRGFGWLALATEVREREGKVAACDGGDDQRSPTGVVRPFNRGQEVVGERRATALKWLEAAMNERTVGGLWNGDSIP